MIGLMMGMLAAGISAPLVEEAVDSAGAATLDAGLCGTNGISRSASVRVTWGLQHVDTAIYTLRLYKDGSILASLAADVTDYDYVVSGVVENGSIAPYSVSWVFRVDVVRNDGVVVSSSTAPAFARTYGQCAGGPGTPT